MKLFDVGPDGKDLNNKRGFHHVRIGDYDNDDTRCELYEIIIWLLAVFLLIQVFINFQHKEKIVHLQEENVVLESRLLKTTEK